MKIFVVAFLIICYNELNYTWIAIRTGGISI